MNTNAWQFTANDSMVADLTGLLRRHLRGERFGNLEIVEVTAESMTIREDEIDPPSMRLEITVVLHMAEALPEWDIEDVLTIRREVRRLSAEVPFPASVRFVPDKDEPLDDEDEALVHT